MGAGDSELRIFGGDSGTNHISFGKYDLGTDAFAEQMRLDNDGNLGIGTTDPKTALDVNGQIKIQKSSSAPFACDSDHDGALALTSTYRTCVCKGGATSWVYTSDGSSACVWQ